MKHLIYLALILTNLPVKTDNRTGPPDLGVFEHLTDIGEPGLRGTARYCGTEQEYLLAGSGKNIWFAEDQFSFLWKRMEGDYMIQARLEFKGEGRHPHRKAGLMIRSGPGPGAAHVSCVVHGDGLTYLQYGSTEGGETLEKKFSLEGPDVLQLEKKGDILTMSVARHGDPYNSKSVSLVLEGCQNAGLFICSHDSAVVEEAVFRNVRIFGTAPDTLVPYRDYLGSMLETLDVNTGIRRTIAASPDAWEAPNWTPDGKALIYNAGGLLYRYDLGKKRSGVLNTGFANRNNNDHVISFDGKQLAISHHAEEDDGASVIYTLPLEGGTPVRVTPNSPSYLHGWSPDGRFLVYTAGREGVYNIYRIPVEGGQEQQLTHEKTLDDGPEYSPDGKYIYFNSARSGTMQIWRMRADGSEAVQLTHDAYNDWFPHISPDGKKIVFLSYSPEVDPSDHPYYKRVYLRMMGTDDPAPRVIAYVYGGQGTINVPSWSPDSRSIAFISHGL